MSQAIYFTPTSGPGSGTVTSISAGTGITLTPNPIVATGTVALTVPVSIADGGTNATSMANTDGVVYFDGTRLVTTAVGTATYVLTSNGAGMAPTFQAASGGGITTAAGDSGTASGSTVTWNANTNSGSTVKFTASAAQVLLSVTDGQNNIAIGAGAGTTFSNGAAINNVGLGLGALAGITSGNRNTCIGTVAGNALTTGQYNTFVGNGAGDSCTTAQYNTCIGEGAGQNYTGSEADNILIGVVSGVAGQNNRLQIGAGTGTGTGQQNSTFISGIQTIVVTGTPVLVSSSDQLGVAASSERYKENINDLASDSSDVLKLRPVSFNYKPEFSQDQSKQSGLIAEEVEKVLPSLVVYDKENKPLSVKYNELPVLLLNELQKALKRIEVLEARLK